MKKILFLIILVLIVLGVFYFINNEVANAPAGDEVKKEGGSGEFCFAKFSEPNKNGYFDRYILRLIIDGETAKGELDFLPAEKDMKTGEFEGKIDATNQSIGTKEANLWWYTVAEGMSAKEELKIKFNDQKANVGAGELVDRGDGVYVYKNPGNISYTLGLNSLSCELLAERANVETFLQENIGDLSPVDPVLGGSWYVVSTILNTDKKTGTVIYEDGHIQEKKDFTYTTGKEGEIINLIIK